MNETSWLRRILENAERDVQGWPGWLQKLRDGSSLDARVGKGVGVLEEKRTRIQDDLPMPGLPPFSTRKERAA